ncbi:hypothetical protein Pth03_04320 [Planotetraspora thailandica]|uniref:Uncharacterized protein n=1 Tax=Planotetraspora thailandica TaxID=487172 RepID=A0A8J3UVI7_9ACTN|nr:hypothetical protein Pth03_04320 [Planotetraspora thailandica]
MDGEQQLAHDPSKLPYPQPWNLCQLQRSAAPPVNLSVAWSCNPVTRHEENGGHLHPELFTT